MNHYKKIIKGYPIPKGADAHDFLMSGWTTKDVISWAKTCVVTVVKDFKLIIQNNVQININNEPGNGPISESLIALHERLNIPLTDNRQPIANLDAVLKILDGMDEFKTLLWFDEFHQRYFTTWGANKPREWSKIDELKLCEILQRKFGFKRLSSETVYQACVIYANRNPKNEPKDWMNTLVWDQTPRIEKFLVECLGAEDAEYTRAVSKNLWIALPARVYTPGCQVDNMAIFESGQGKFKSTALNIIGGPWYTEVHESLTSKDFYLLLQGKLIIEISELEAFSRTEVNMIKKVITCRVDRFRPPYDRTAKDFPRQCIFIGSTNDNEYLKDHTGGRRFWPIKVDKINLELIKETREQLFAEAVVRFKNGENWHIMPQMETIEAQESRRQSDAWENIIAEYLIGKQEIRLEDLANQALNIDKGKLTMTEQRRIGRILTRFGLIKKNGMRNGIQLRIWAVPNAENNPE